MKKYLNLNYFLGTLAILGIVAGVYMFIIDGKTQPIEQPPFQPSIPPFNYFIAGSGIIESQDVNITLGTEVPGAVDQVFVVVGDLVKKDAALFTLDSRQVKADLETKIADLNVAETSVVQAEASLKSAQDQLDLIDHVKDKRAIAKQDLVTRQNNVLMAKAALENAISTVLAVKAQVDEAQIILDLYTVKAPVDCEILQVNVRPGQYASTGMNTPPLMLIGKVDRYHVRVDVDENDAWRFKRDAKAIAFLRGNVQFNTTLKFEYLEPYIIPKQALTGDTTELVDTRVLQVIYSYRPEEMPAYIGQQVDVYIEADKVSSDVRFGGPEKVSQ